VAKEGANGGESARDRRRRETVCAELSDVRSEIVGARACRRAAEPLGEVSEVAPVCLDGARREPRCREGKESLDVAI
jgi:hypothetical protein